jgi:hypothetical protein
MRIIYRFPVCGKSYINLNGPWLSNS